MGSKFVINSLPKTARKRNLITPGLRNHAKRLFGTKMLAYKRSTSIDESTLIKNADIIKKMTEAGLFEVRIDSMNGPILDLSEVLSDGGKATPPTPPTPVVPPKEEEKEEEGDDEPEENEVIGGEYSQKTKSELILMLHALGVTTPKGELRRLRKSELIVMLRDKS